VLRRLKPLSEVLAAQEQAQSQEGTQAKAEAKSQSRPRVTPEVETVAEIVEEAPPPPQPEIERTVFPEVDRRKIEGTKLDRRALEEMLADVQWTAAAEQEDRRKGRRPAALSRFQFKPSRLALLGVALVAGGLAAFIAFQSQPSAPQPVVAEAVPQKVIEEPRTKVLVAQEQIGIGDPLKADSIGWEDWPEASVRPEFVTISASPDAETEMVGEVARYVIFPGEPIRQDKLSQNGPGLLSSVLSDGMRGVSVAVSAESASGGFVNPGDHVDVVLTRPIGDQQVSKIVLSNVRVLAINTRLGTTDGGGDGEKSDASGAGTFSGRAVATLALDPHQAEAVINAQSIGPLSLVLRAVTDFSETAGEGQNGLNQAIRISSPFWTK